MAHFGSSNFSMVNAIEKRQYGPLFVLDHRGVREFGTAAFHRYLMLPSAGPCIFGHVAVATFCGLLCSRDLLWSGALGSLLGRIFCGKPVSTFPENALMSHVKPRTRNSPSS